MFGGLLGAVRWAQIQREAVCGGRPQAVGRRADSCGSLHGGCDVLLASEDGRIADQDSGCVSYRDKGTEIKCVRHA